MVVAEVSILPIGTQNTSISKYVVDAIKILKASGVKYEITPMCTVMEGSLDQVLEVTHKMHEEVFKKGCLRVLTTLKIDDRRDRKISLRSKLKSVVSKL